MIVFDIKGKKPVGLTEDLIQRSAREISRVLRREGSAVWSISVGFVPPSKIRRLNQTYRGKPKATDVLSFEAGSNGAYPILDQKGKTVVRERGDILICPSVVRRNASEQGVPYVEELVRLLVHGALHLFGYDHERPADERVMFALQEKAVVRLCAHHELRAYSTRRPV